jgi:PAS domain S-box-containing protein
MDAAEEPYREYFKQSPIGVFVVDGSGTYLDVNPSGCELVGYSRPELRSMTVSDLAAGDGAPVSFAQVKDRDRISTETRLRHADGHEIDVLLDAAAMGEDRFVAYVRDICDRKAREREVKELKDRFEMAIEGANLGVWDWDLRTDAVEFDDQWARMLGFEPGEIDQDLTAWKSRVHPEDLDRVLANVEAHLDGEREYIDTEHRLRTADADWKWIRDIGHVTDWDGGEPVRAVGIHQDIDERKRAEQARKAARDQLRQVIDLVPDLIFVKDREGTYLLANEAVAEAYDRPVEEIIGKTDHELLFTEEHPEQFREDDLAVIESGEPKTIHEDLVTADGKTRKLRTTKIPYEQVGSDEPAVLGYARDVTELESYERQLETQRDNLEVLNQIVRHDIRNDLQLVVAHAELLQDHVDEAGRDHLDPLRSAAQDAVEITRTARDVTEVLLQSEAERSPINLESVLEAEIESARSNNENAVITTAGPIPDLQVLADDLLESVFRNLLQNAIVHNDQELPEVTIATIENVDSVAVEIRDNGPGIPEERKAEIFEEGNRGLDSEGTGLGLYLVETLVDRYEGTVTVADNEPRGAVFRVELPTV